MVLFFVIFFFVIALECAKAEKENIPARKREVVKHGWRRKAAGPLPPRPKRAPRLR
jgi:hypothetical protein